MIETQDLTRQMRQREIDEATKPLHHEIESLRAELKNKQEYIIHLEAAVTHMRAELEATKEMRDSVVKDLSDAEYKLAASEQTADINGAALVETQEELFAMKQQRDELAAALEKLARLGNEPHYGNSIGNQIARDVLAKVGAVSPAQTFED
jgi:septal ring factor EnvC (AmiA/AmiB activator)